MSKPKVAIALIVKAGDDSLCTELSRALGSINGYVDAIYVQLNAPKGKTINEKIREVAKRFTDHIYDYEWSGNFVAARNAIFSKVPKEYDWIGWLDHDDIIDKPENIWPVLAVMPDTVHGLHILYDYQKDEHGNVVVAHWSCRFVRNDGSYTWKSSIDDDEVSVHETLVPRRTVQAVSNNEFKVVHMAEPGHYKESLLRNIELLEGMARRQSEKPQGIDPRILFYLGSHYFEAYRFRESKTMFYEYLKLSGWEEERSQAHVYMGRLLKMEENYAAARTAFLMAIGEYQGNPDPYLELGKLEAKEQRHEQAVEWLRKCISIKRKTTGMVQFNNQFESYSLLAQELANLGGKHLTEALEMANEALKLQPFDQVAKQNRDEIEKLIVYKENNKAVATLIRALRDEEQDNRVINLLDSLPDSLDGSPVVIQAYQEYTPPKVWSKKSIAIYVGQGPLGIWGPWSLNEGGIGGSEEAVVRLSNELAMLGWRVTVFGMPGKRAGFYNPHNNHGPINRNRTMIAVEEMSEKNRWVEWRQYWEINNKDTFDVLISWRQPAFFDFDWKARKKYLWLHDVVDKEELIPERLERIDKIIYVSKYHSERPESDEVPISKKLPSGNGITPSDFEKYDNKFGRDARRCIYMSANERGLRILLDVWPEIHEEVPEATLDVYYGWHSFDAINRDNPERMAWKAYMQKQMRDLPGVTERGRVGQDELNQEIFKSGLFTYPCTFPEVNCITAQKAMAGGAVPVTSDYAVLKDIIQYGEQVEMHDFTPEDIERYKKRLIYWLKHPEKQEKVRAEMMKWARDTFAWSNTAKQWDEEMR